MVSWEKAVSLTLSFLYLHFVKSTYLVPFCVSISQIHRVGAEIKFQHLYICPLFCLLQAFSSFPEVWLKSFSFFFLISFVLLPHELRQSLWSVFQSCYNLGAGQSGFLLSFPWVPESRPEWAFGEVIEGL